MPRTDNEVLNKTVFRRSKGKKITERSKKHFSVILLYGELERQFFGFIK